ncbi:MAG: glycerol-3-phosphate 1-O-acyltransferase PlsY [Cyanobacteria bacterium TGS_CYA1]|nr:glycerol-3-phosphate 1-O-acyltransferase PlsY [Cyanobacteria bacterium TGS_CYA1]
MSIVIAISSLVLAYLLGSIPTGFWVAKIAKGIDIRKEGSGSTGATNVLRCVGKKEAAFVMFFDIFKGYLAVAISIYLESAYSAELFGVRGLLPVFAAVISLVGHSKSIFLNFQGGKSVATGLGTYFALNWLVAVCAFSLWVTLIFVTRYVSLASIIGTFSCLVFMILFGSPLPYIIYAVIAFTYITARHKENVKRLMNGTEPKFGKKATDKKEDSPKGDANE